MAEYTAGDNHHTAHTGWSTSSGVPPLSPDFDVSSIDATRFPVTDYKGQQCVVFSDGLPYVLYGNKVCRDIEADLEDGIRYPISLSDMINGGEKVAELTEIARQARIYDKHCRRRVTHEDVPGVDQTLENDRRSEAGQVFAKVSGSAEQKKKGYFIPADNNANADSAPSNEVT